MQPQGREDEETAVLDPLMLFFYIILLYYTVIYDVCPWHLTKTFKYNFCIIIIMVRKCLGKNLLENNC